MLGMAGGSGGVQPSMREEPRQATTARSRRVHPMKTSIPELDIRKRREWRKWLERNHESSAGVWLVFHKQHTGVESIDYDDSVREALCFGWIDSLVKRLDE